MRPFNLKLSGVCILAATLVTSSASADQGAICDALKHLATKEYREKTAEAKKKIKGPEYQTLYRAGNLFTARLTPEHLNYIAAAKADQLSYSRLASVLNEEVIKPILEDLRAVGKISKGTYPYQLEVIVRPYIRNPGVILTACASKNNCFNFNLLAEPDYRKAVDREVRRLAFFPENSEIDYVRDSLPSVCRQRDALMDPNAGERDALMDPNAIETENTQKSTPTPSSPLPSGCYQGYASLCTPCPPGYSWYGSYCQASPAGSAGCYFNGYDYVCNGVPAR